MDQLSCLTAFVVFLAVCILFVMVVSILSRKGAGTPTHYIPDMPKLPPEQKAMIMGRVDASQLFDGPVLPHPPFRRSLNSQINTLVIEGVTEAVFMLYQSISEQLKEPAVIICSCPINPPGQVPPEFAHASWNRLVFQIQNEWEYLWARSIVAQVPHYVPFAAMELYLKPLEVIGYIPQPDDRYVHAEVMQL